jgi:peptidoglycan/xylan/chitin deacetylase (PgdA/CDA1 family)
MFLLFTAGCGAAKTSAKEGTMDKNVKSVDVPVVNPGEKTTLPQVPDPPGGLQPEKVPMFVSLGFDDNGVPGTGDAREPQGMEWAVQMFDARKNSDGTLTRASFYLTSSYAVGEDNGYGEATADISPVNVKRLWNTLYSKGHEIGNHTNTHPHGVDEETGREMTVDEWVAEMTRCNDIISAPFNENEPFDKPDKTKGAGISRGDIKGFRTPFLEYTDNTFAAMTQMNFVYDCSIEEGLQPDQDGTDFTWPYKLDNGSRGHDLLVEWEMKAPLQNHPGLWEMPVYAVIVPPDSECDRYGVAPGFRERMKKAADYFDIRDGKITGFDYNLWVLFHMTKAEFTATLKYTFDLRLKGNRAPFLFGMHSDIYADGYDEADMMKATTRERQEAVELFVDYVLNNNAVRVVPAIDVLKWIQNPEAI